MVKTKDIKVEEMKGDVVSKEHTESKIPPTVRRRAVKRTLKTKEDKIGKFMARSTIKAQPVKIPRKFNLWKIALVLGIIVFIVAGGWGGYYFYHKYKNSNAITSETDKLIIKVGKLIVLPDEAVTIATVTDKAKLAGQPFFAQAENGDKALIYTQAKKAILYRPTSNKIIEVMYISADQNKGTGNLETEAQPDQGQSPIPASVDSIAATHYDSASQPADTQNVTPANTVILNGTLQKGLAQNMADKLTSITEVKVVSTGNAKDNYAKTLVIDLSGSHAAAAQKIAATFGAEVGALPAGEIKPENADILVIGGGDFKN